MEWKRDILVHQLESLEDEWVTGGGRFNAVGESYINYIDEEGWGKESDSVIIVGMGEKIQAMVTCTEPVPCKVRHYTRMSKLPPTSYKWNPPTQKG